MFDGTSDQYIVDTVDTTADIGPRSTALVARDYESKFMGDQYFPTYYQCRCGSCPGGAWPRGPPPLRKKTIAERTNDMLRQRPKPAQPVPTNVVKPPEPAVDVSTITALIFVFIIFICVYCVRAMADMRGQIKSLKQMLSART